MKQLKEVSKRVKQLMELIPMVRDSDKHLIAAMHREDIANAGLISSNCSYQDYENLFLYGKMTDPNRIARARRIIEHDYPKLRGSTYPARQIKAGVVRVEINKI
jgi:hypothetical protein